jgi:hypothetical protein
MRTPEQRASRGQNRRLQVALILLILWDLFALAAELSFGSPLLRLEDERIGGWLAARGSFSGAAMVTLVMYAFALLRGPSRHRGVLWAGVVQQAAAALFGVYHWASKDITLEGMALTLAVSLGLLVVLLLNMPRFQPAAA